MMHLCKTLGNFWPPPLRKCFKKYPPQSFPTLQKIPLFCLQISPFCVNLVICGPFCTVPPPRTGKFFSKKHTKHSRVLLKNFYGCFQAVQLFYRLLCVKVRFLFVFPLYEAIVGSPLQKMCSITLLFSKIATLLRIFILIIQNIDCFWCSLFFESSLLQLCQWLFS